MIYTNDAAQPCCDKIVMTDEEQRKIAYGYLSGEKDSYSINRGKQNSK